MGFEYVQAKRTTNFSLPHRSWTEIGYDTVITDTHSRFSADTIFTAGSDGLLFVLSTRPHNKAVNTNTSTLGKMRVNLVERNDYRGQREVNPVIAHGIFDFKRVNSGDAIVHRMYGNEARTCVPTDDKFNIQYFFIPDGEGLGPVIEQHTNAANWASITEGAGFFDCDEFDTSVYGEDAWKGVDNKTFTMPADGYVWASLKTVATADSPDQRWSAGLRVEVNGTPDNMTESWMAFNSETWHKDRNVLLAVSGGDELVFQHAIRSRSSKTYIVTGFDANTREDLLLTVRFFAG